MRARRTDMEVRSARRGVAAPMAERCLRSRPRTLSTRPAPTAIRTLSSPRSSVMLPWRLAVPKSPQSRFFVDSDAASVGDATPPQAPSFTSPRAASPSRSPVRAVAQSQSPSRRSPQRQASGETHQARRVNFAGQRAKAVAVASPHALESPRLEAEAALLFRCQHHASDSRSGPERGGQAASRSRASAEREVVAAKEASAAASASHTGSAKTVEAAEVATKPQSASVENALPSRQGAVTPTQRPLAHRRVQRARTGHGDESRERLLARIRLLARSRRWPLFFSSRRPFQRRQCHGQGRDADHSRLGRSRAELRWHCHEPKASPASFRRPAAPAAALQALLPSRVACRARPWSVAARTAQLRAMPRKAPTARWATCPASTRLDFSPTKMTSSASLASTVGTSIFEVETEMRDVSTAKSNAESTLRRLWRWASSRRRSSSRVTRWTPTQLNQQQTRATARPPRLLRVGRWVLTLRLALRCSRTRRAPTDSSGSAWISAIWLKSLASVV